MTGTLPRTDFPNFEVVAVADPDEAGGKRPSAEAVPTMDTRITVKCWRSRSETLSALVGLACGSGNCGG